MRGSKEILMDMYERQDRLDKKLHWIEQEYLNYGKNTIRNNDNNTKV